MPTGYTAKLMEEGQTFQEFVLTCARAFGPLIIMRDDPMDAPIPEKFEPSDYYSKRIKEATELLISLKGITNEEKINFGQVEKDKKVKHLKEWLKKAKKENTYLTNMQKLVQAWVPPTSDHQGLKDFMLEQIKISWGEEDYIVTEIAKAEKSDPMGYYITSLSEATRDIEYNVRESEKEIERVNARNEWLRQLRLSI